MSIDREYAVIQVRYRVASGFWGAEEITETVIEECFDPAQVTGDDKAWVARLIEEAILKQAEAEKSWPAVTDWDRLDQVFQKLDRSGIIALHHAGMTQSDGTDDITEVYHDRGGKDSSVIGYCFYHHQDVQRAIDGHGLLLTFGDIAGDNAKGVDIGRRIAAALQRSGFRVIWNGAIEQRINIEGIRWQKRCTS
jgi:hypothetical protein